jgi:hypothetical protein
MVSQGNPTMFRPLNVAMTVIFLLRIFQGVSWKRKSPQI